jgi:peptide/nickel transport system permease protein
VRLFQYLTRRILWAIVVLFGVSLITFTLSHLIPGDPARFAVGLDAGDEQVQRYRELLGLDRPVWEQYLRYLGRLVRGDLGVSVVSRRPVLEDLRIYLPATLELVFYAMTVTLVVSILLGMFVARRSDSVSDQMVRVLTTFGMAAPAFWLALMLQLIFYGRLEILPFGGRSATPVPDTTGFYTLDAILARDIDRLLETWKYLLLPVVALTVPRIAILSRMVRSSMLDVLRGDFIRTARAKGLAERTVQYRHAFRNALIPVVTLAALQLGWMLGGTVIIETIFRWPGIGQYAVYGILNLDYPAIVGSALVITFFFVVINLLTDLLYAWLDPRIRLGGNGGG